MARRIRSASIETRSTRLTLPRQRKPHAMTNVAPGIRLGYRRTRHAGTWVGAAADGKGGAWTFRVGTADDFEVADGEHVLDFWQAAERARAMARGQKGDSKPATVAAALDDYESNLRVTGGDAANATRVRHHLTPALLNKPVAMLTGAELRKWRNTLLADGITPQTVVRTCKSFRAALNMAADHDPKRISDRSAWKTGLAGLADAYEAVNKVQPDAKVLELVGAAYALDEEFGLFVHVAAETGARASQVAKLLVADLQTGRDPKLLMPTSKKGRGRKASRRPTPITAALAAKLELAARDRATDAPLLLRADGERWNPDKASHLQAPFALIAKQVGISETMYCLRHSSIVRSLLAGTPTRLVASIHDTGTAILEKVYSAFIADYGDAIARRGLLDTAPVAGNVVKLPKGRR
jgi:integrase